MSSSNVSAAQELDIIDIRRDKVQQSLLDELTESLQREDGVEKRIPTMFLYDEKGLKLFEDITYLDQYYLTKAEISALQQYADKIVENIADGALIVELGSGNLRKVNILLQALEAAQKNVDYYALDLSYPELERSLSMIPTGAYQHVRCHALHGTYDDGLAWLQHEGNGSRPVIILWLGSSIGNLTRTNAAGFLRTIDAALKPDDQLLIGFDGCQDATRIHAAYNDRDGTTHAFLRNGLDNVNRTLGYDLFDHDTWRIVRRYNTEHGRHEAFACPLEDVSIGKFNFQKGEHVRLETSHKYSAEQREKLVNDSDMQLSASFSDETGTYFLNLFKPLASKISPSPENHAAAAAATATTAVPRGEEAYPQTVEA